MAKEIKLTPMVQQYNRVKAQHPNEIVMFRMGDFYEMFNEDAKTAAEVLQIALTKRADGMPLAGVPYHAVNAYLKKFTDAGFKVAICDQVEDARKAKGLVRREVTRVITPGTVVEAAILEDKRNNFLVSVHRTRTKCAVAAADLSTGRFEITEFNSSQGSQELLSELWRLRPSEVLIAESLSDEFRSYFNAQFQPPVTVLSDSHFRESEARRLLCEQFQVQGLAGFGADELSAALSAAGAVVQYLRETQRMALGHFKALKVYAPSDYMIVDQTTQRSLELAEAVHGGKDGTLLSIIDHTRTSMGGRLLRQWLLQPLKSIEAIGARQEAIAELVDDFALRDGLSKILRTISDIERIVSRVSVGAANGRDLVALRQSLEQLPQLVQLLSNARAPRLRELIDKIDPVPELRKYLQQLLIDSPPVTLREGGLIRDGADKQVDELRAITRDSKSWINQLRQDEIEKTGIQKLKIGFNRVFGYYIEVSKAHSDQVPEHYIRKQTLVNAERFITPELKEKEDVILNAEEKLHDLEFALFEQVRERVREHTAQLQQLAKRLAEIDCLFSMAEAALAGGYVRPEMNDDGRLEIADGRHPVLEAIQRDPPFVPNHAFLNGEDHQILLITGPNMAGKSTYIRQVALIALLAHTGSFVPARSASICLTDRIFTRIGAMDHLTKGQSTFLVEMAETANILNNATNRSLVILDEIGRGTSTYDGLSIAWAVIEQLHNQKGRCPKTLFATHYHELIALEEHLKRVKNYNVAVLEERDRVIFLYKIERGATDRSYGIYAAQLAGVPQQVVERARSILQDLEDGNAVFVHSHQPRRSGKAPEAVQLTLFDNVPHPALERLRLLNPENLTPLEALNALAELYRLSQK